MVHYLTESLIAMGHQLTLFASGDSLTAGRLIAGAPGALRLAGCRDPIPPHVVQLQQVLSRASEFDIIHFHTDFWHFPLVRQMGLRAVTTVHGRLDLPELVPLFDEFRDIPMISISDSQRRPLPEANWVGTVYHGLPPNLLPFQPLAKGGYLAFTGRICPEKRPDLAIEIAMRAGIELRIAAKVDAADRDYFAQVIKPLLDRAGSAVRFEGEIGDREKAEFLGNAVALLFPIDWPEPFGLVMIESMSCGTPVIAMRRGSVPEVVDHGVSGLIIDSVEEGVAAVQLIAGHTEGQTFGGRLLWQGRRAVREVFESRFTAQRMAEDYSRLYRRLWSGGRMSSTLLGRPTVGAEHGRNR